MKSLFYYLSLPFIYAVSLLPFFLLHLLADLAYMLVFHVLGYRRKVAEENLRNAFPDKTEDERKLILKRFYRYLCDLSLETLKTLTISPEQARKRVVFKDISVIEKYYREKQSIIVVMGHFGNWELAGARFAVEKMQTLCVIYHPLKNPHFDQLFYTMRTRLGNRLYPMKHALRGIIGDRDKLTATVFIADQSPSAKSAYWTQFLNQDTAVFTGTEKIAKKMKYPVVYASVKRTARSRYSVTVDLLADQPEHTAENEISELQTRRLERDIIEQPEIWLWTHRRWKQKR